MTAATLHQRTTSCCNIDLFALRLQDIISVASLTTVMLACTLSKSILAVAVCRIECHVPVSQLRASAASPSTVCNPFVVVLIISHAMILTLCLNFASGVACCACWPASLAPCVRHPCYWPGLARQGSLRPPLFPTYQIADTRAMAIVWQHSVLRLLG